MQKLFMVIAFAFAHEALAYLPLEAVHDINNGRLTYMGRDLFPGSFHNSSCVYKSDSAYVIYNNCPLSKLEAPATDIEVISFKGGLIRFYIENESARAVSKLTRAQYDSTWTVEFTMSKVPGNLSVKGLMDYKEDVYNGNDPVCYVGESFEALNFETKGKCLGNNPIGITWLPGAEAFWREPGEAWYSTKKYLRKIINETKF
jgi:hypothetical protein